MPIGELCKHPVIVVEPEHSVRAAATLMREHHVGALVVVSNDGTRKPVGIVTDRDIAIGVVAVGLDAEVLTVGDIMGPRLVTAPVDQGVLETVRQMRTKGIRRLPLVAHDGALAGLVTLDDLLALLAGELDKLAGLVTREQAIEEKTRR
jgi:CBS domain-containing protein